MLIHEKILYQVTMLITFGRRALENLSKSFWKSSTIRQTCIVFSALGNLPWLETAPTTLVDVSGRQVLWCISYMGRKGTGF